MSSNAFDLHPMRRVAIFGNAGGGKSRLARQLAEATGLPLYCLDKIQFPEGRYRRDEPEGGKLANEEYLKLHAGILRQDAWIIDGFGTFASAWERFAEADTLVYIDLPLGTHYSWVTKRLAAGLFRTPAGWPEASPVWASSLASYRVVWQCHRLLTPRYRKLVADARSSKRVHHLKSAADIGTFLGCVGREESR
jgi:adenylate kinase family enzyme